MLLAAGPDARCQATVELQLGVTTSSAQEASPLPRPAFLWRGDASELAASEEEDQDSEEKCVNTIKKYTWLQYFACVVSSLIRVKVEM